MHASLIEPLANVMTEVLRQIVEQYPTITALFSQVWEKSTKSAKLTLAFEEVFKEMTEKLLSFLTPYVSPYPNLSGLNSAEVTSRIFLGLYQDLVIQLISQHELLNESQFRDALRSLVIHALRDIHFSIR